MEIENRENIIGKRKEMENTGDKEPPFQLTGAEDALFALLMEVVEHFKLHAVLRVAGGWVRDKLMASTLQFESVFTGKVDILLYMHTCHFSDGMLSFCQTRSCHFFETMISAQSGANIARY